MVRLVRKLHSLADETYEPSKDVSDHPEEAAAYTLVEKNQEISTEGT